MPIYIYIRIGIYMYIYANLYMHTNRYPRARASDGRSSVYCKCISSSPRASACSTAISACCLARAPQVVFFFPGERAASDARFCTSKTRTARVY